MRYSRSRDRVVKGHRFAVPKISGAGADPEADDRRVAGVAGLPSRSPSGPSVVVRCGLVFIDGYKTCVPWTVERARVALAEQSAFVGSEVGMIFRAERVIHHAINAVVVAMLVQHFRPATGSSGVMTNGGMAARQTATAHHAGCCRNARASHPFAG